MRSPLLLLLLALLGLTCAACSGDRANLRGQLAELRRLHSQLEDQWAQVDREIGHTQDQIDRLQRAEGLPQEARLQALLRLALLQCFVSPPGALEDAALAPPSADAAAQAPPADPTAPPCDSEAAGVLLAEPALSTSDREAARAALLTTAQLKLALRRDLPQRARDLASRHAEARNRLQEISLDADISLAQFEDGGLFGDSDGEAFKQEYGALQEELLRLGELLEQLQGEALLTPERLQRVSEGFASALVHLGAPPPPSPLEPP